MKVRIDDRDFDVEIIGNGVLRVTGARTVTAWVARGVGVQWVYVDGAVYELPDASQDAGPRRRSGSQQGSMSAPMPATVRKLAVKPGDQVKPGDVLIVLEAMKMELPVRAGVSGTVTAIHCREGELVQPGVTLIDIDEGGAAS
jgi:biotin carboxyl carrier protein